MTKPFKKSQTKPSRPAAGSSSRYGKKGPSSSAPAKGGYGPKPTGGEARTARTELLSKIARVKRQLEDMRDYKRILVEDGLEPDEDDKFRESGLIKNLLSLEKRLNALAQKPRPRPAAAAGASKKSFNTPASSQQGRRSRFQEQRRKPRS